MVGFLIAGHIIMSKESVRSEVTRVLLLCFAQVTSKHKKDSSKSATYGQPWTVEEQVLYIWCAERSKL